MKTFQEGEEQIIDGTISSHHLIRRPAAPFRGQEIDNAKSPLKVVRLPVACISTRRPRQKPRHDQHSPIPRQKSHSRKPLAGYFIYLWELVRQAGCEGVMGLVRAGLLAQVRQDLGRNARLRLECQGTLKTLFFQPQASQWRLAFREIFMTPSSPLLNISVGKL